MRLHHKLVIAICAACAIVMPDRSHADPDAYIPGLGEFMAATQMRHSKLWFAGQARNWALASYELEEIREGFDDITRFHPVHKGSPVAIAEILPEITAAPVRRLESAINAEDPVAFEEAFDSLTAACNACHREEDFEFNVIKRPGANPYTNQDFSPVPQPEPVPNQPASDAGKQYMPGKAR